MPLSLQRKKELVERYQRNVAVAPHVFLLGFKGISVPQVTELRDRIREHGGHYQVVKNRLMLRAIGGTTLDELREKFDGPTAVVYGDDPVGLAKVLSEFAKASPVLEFKGGLVEGQQVAGEEIVEIASLPSREALIAKLLFILQSPISGLARALAAVPRQLVIVLDQIRQRQGDGSADG